MYRTLGLAAAAVFVAGCGQYGFPGAQAARPAVVVETTYAQVAVAPPPVVIHEVSYETQPAVVNTNTNNTTIATQPAMDRTVVVREGSRYRSYARHRPLFIAPILRVLFNGPRGHMSPPPPRWRGRPDEGGRRQDPRGHNGPNRPNNGPGGHEGRRGGRGGRGGRG